MNQRYGFFGGCFNPVTKAHLNLASQVVERFNLDKLVFVPMGDKYQKQDLANEQARYEMLKIATKSNEKLDVSNIELHLPYALTMLQAFQKIQEAYPKVAPYFIMGADNIEKLINLPNFEILVQSYNYIILERDNIPIREYFASNPILKRFRTRFNILTYNPYKQISSTEVRRLLKSNNENKVVEMLVEEVYEYIKENKIY